MTSVGRIPNTLFDYPRRAGYKERTTSKDAADNIEKKGRATLLRKRVLEVLELRGHFGMSADEIATALGEDRLSIRPRVSELKKAGLIVATASKVRNESGALAHVFIKNGR